MAPNNPSNLEAIQIIQSLKNDDSKEPQVIKLIEKDFNGPRLKDVLCGENKDLPIFVISICGKTRTGKSFLLNLMIKYLESKGFEDLTDGVLPNVFQWKSGTKSVTRGLWICPKVFKRRNQHGKEVGILLLDNQGLFDGEQTDGVSMAISGMSTALSCYQIFNLKEKICENDLESIWRNLTSDDINLSDASATKLVFVVRDYLDEDKGCGLDHGRAYIEDDMSRGTPAHKDMWEGLRKTFPEIICLLLPFPGEKVRKGTVKYMKDIEPAFLAEIEQFFSKMFDPKYLNDTKNTSRGQQIYETLKKFDGKVADESLSFANVFTEQGNQNKLEFLMNNFESSIESFHPNPSNVKSLIESFLTMAKHRFKGNSADDHLVKLETFMTRKINLTVKNLILNEYKSSLRNSTSASYTHSLEYDSVKTRLGYFVGSEAEKNELKEKVIVGCADLYYRTLREQLAPLFESYCEHKTLVDLDGYDETFVSNEFKENDDFMVHLHTTKQSCKAIWLREREILHNKVQDKLLTFVAALTDFDKEWLKNATQTQFKFYEMFTWNESHWIKINRGDNSLKELIGYTMYKTTQKLSEYSEDQMKPVTRIAGQIEIQSVCDPITLSCIFILYRHENNESCEPLYKVRNHSRCTFIDIKGRAYQSWEDYENDNKLPDCLYCHPSEGKYDRERGFRVAFKWSPASSFGNKLLKVLDVAGKVVAIGSAAALGAVVAFPAATVAAVGGAIAAGLSGGYGIIRGIFKITDKVSHDEVVEALDVVDMVANGLSVASAGVTAGAVVLTTVGRELACAPAVIQSISSLTNLAFQLNRENISYLSLANDISMFLLFNSKSIEGAIDNIRTSYRLAPETSSLDTLRGFISKNSISFPKMDGERLTTQQFFSENLKSFLVTAIMNKFEERPLQFVKETVDTLEELRPLQNLFGNSSHREQIQFFEELIKLIGKIIPKKRNTNSRGVSHRGTGYLPTTTANSEVAQAGVCTSLTSISECPFDECVQQICFVAREILKLIYENAETTNLEGPTAYLKENGSEVEKKVLGMF